MWVIISALRIYTVAFWSHLIWTGETDILLGVILVGIGFLGGVNGGLLLIFLDPKKMSVGGIKLGRFFGRENKKRGTNSFADKIGVGDDE